MRFWLILSLLTALGRPVLAHDLPQCDDSETDALRQIGIDELASHGGGEWGPVDYPAGTLHRNFRFYVDYVIAIDGHVTCIFAYEDKVMSGDYSEAEMTPQRQALLDRLATRTFTPFANADNQPEKVIMRAAIDEQELPYRHIDPPPGDMASTVIKLKTSGHRTPEHGYSMTLNGEGDATFDDGGHTETYRIPPERVTAMLDMANKADFWSLKDVYTPPLDPTTPWAYAEEYGYYQRVSIVRGGRSKSVTIYDWGNTGAPFAARELMENMASLGGLDLIGYWGVTHDMIDLKVYNNFDFSSAEGGQLLIRATATEEKYNEISDSDIYGLIARGAPLDYVSRGELDTGLLDAAIDGRRWELAVNLIAQGALLTDEKPDKAKVTRALAHAVAEASPDVVAELMPYRPQLSIRHTVDNGIRKRRETDPIITFVGSYRSDPSGEEPKFTADLVKVTQLLLAAGADLNSRDSLGRNLLDNAADKGQADFVRWLITQGADVYKAFADVPTYGDSGNDADVALALLEGGAEPGPARLHSLIENARLLRWTKVEAWLRAHGKWPEE